MSDKITVIAAKDFELATSCRDTVHVKKGDSVDVPKSSLTGMILAQQVEQPKGKKFAEKLDGAMTTKDADGDKSKRHDKSKK